MPRLPPLSSLKKGLRLVGGGVALALVFVMALALGAVLHLDLPVTRRATGSLLGSFLTSTFRGQISLGQLDRLDAFGVTAHGIEVRDPNGRLVLGVQELDISLDLFGVVQRAARLFQKLSIEVDGVRISGVDLTLLSSTERDADGHLLTHPSIADAFALQKVSEATHEEGRPLRIWFRDVQLARVFATSQITSLPVLQANAPAARCTLLITNKGVALDVSRFGLTASGVAGADTAASGSVHIRAPGALYGDLDGKVGDVGFSETFRYDKGRLELKGALPELKPEAVRALWSDWPLDRTISVEHTVSGVPPRLSVEALVHTERGDASAKGIITVSPEFEADLDVDTQELDLSALRSDLPRTELSVRSAVDIWQGTDIPHMEVNATLLPTEALGAKVPAIDFVGTYDERGVLLNATVHERGLPLHFLLEKPEKGQLSFELSLRKTQLEESPRLFALLGARGTLAGTITGKLEEQRVEARSNFKGSGLAIGGATVDGFSLTGTTRVPLDQPSQAELALSAQASGVAFRELRFDKADATVLGPMTRPRISIKAAAHDGTMLALSATTRTDRIEVDDAKLDVTGRGTPIGAQIRHLSFDQGRLVVDDFHLQSEGRLDADLDLTAQGGEVHIDGDKLNIQRLAEAAGLSAGTAGGRLTIQVNASLGSSSQGSAHIAVKDGQLLGLTGVGLDLSTELLGHKTSGSWSAELQDFGHASGSWQGELAGHPFHAPSYTNATGSAKAELLELDLAQLSRLVGDRSGLFARSGNLTGNVTLDRKSAGTLPLVELEANTSGLALDVGTGPKPVRVDGVDLHVATSLQSADNRLQIAARASDFAGDLVAVGGSLVLPFDAWGEHWPDAPALKDTLLAAPLEVVISVPRRRIDDFPGALSLPTQTGTLAGRGTIQGTLTDPSFQLTLAAQGLGGANLGLTGPIELDANLRYKKKTGRLVGELRARKEVSQIGAATFDLLLPLEHLSGSLAPGQPAWTGRVQAVFDGAPLEMLSVLSERDLEGQLQGAVTIERSALMPVIAADLRVRRLAVADRKLGEGSVSVESHDSSLLAKTQFDDEYGTLSASAEIGLLADAWLVRPDDAKPIYITLRSEKYDAAVLSPFLKDQLSEFGGALNGTLRLEVRPPETPGNPRGTRFSGQMRMSEAVITPASMGLRLEDTSFDINAGPEGALNVVRLTNLKARARSDVHNLSGSATLYFDNLDLVRGQFQISPQAVPVLSNGTKLADLSGQLSGSLEAHGDETRVVVEIPTLNVDLPASADRELIALSDNPTIEILQPLVAAPPAKDASEHLHTWLVDVRLGQEVRIKNRIISLQLRGNPKVRYGNEMNIEGEIALVPGGRIQVLGRVFVLDHGSVSFDTEDATNPHLDVTATWRTPNGILVRATVGGTANKPQLEWSSDPPQPGGESAIIAMVLGGSSGGGQGGDVGGAGLAAGAAAINEMVGKAGVQGIEIYASRQTDSGGKGQAARLSDRTWDNYTAAYQVSDELWFEGSYKQQSQGPDNTPRSGFSGTLDWRFDPAWSVRTEIGTLGVGSDLLWQYRY